MRATHFVCCLALLAMMSASLVPSFGQSSPDTATLWLTQFCGTDDNGGAQAVLAQAGVSVEPALIQAAQNGPSADYVTAITQQFGGEYDITSTYIATHGTDMGLSTSDIQAAISITRDQFLAQHVNDAILAYRSRALMGLGIVADATGIQVLQSFAQDNTSPLQNAAKAALRQLTGGTNTAPTASVGPNQRIECSSPIGTPVTLTGSATDSDGDPLALAWKNSNGTVVGTSATLIQSLPLGTFSYSFTATDSANLSSTATTSVTVQDTTAPALSLSKASVTAVIPTASASTMAVSLTGIASAIDICDANPTLTNNAPSPFPIGLTNVMFTATDHSGNASQRSITVQVEYVFGGINPPIPQSVFSVGQAIPVKFQLFAANHTIVGSAVANLQAFRVTSTGLVPINVVSAGSSNTGTLFRYDPLAKQYVYNLRTTSYVAGNYLLRVALNDRTTHDVSIVLH